MLMAILALNLIGVSFAQDPGWPRVISRPDGKLVYYQPHVDAWKDFRTLEGRLAVSLTPAGGKEAIGVVSLETQTDVSMDKHLVVLSNPKITQTHFPSLDPDAAAKMDQLARTFLAPTVTTTISLERLIASTEKSKEAPAVPVKNDPPPIFVSYAPAMLLIVDSEPVRAPLQDTKLAFVVNANWPLFFDTAKPQYYLLAGDQWLAASALAGPWAKVTALPKDFTKLPNESNWADVKKAVPPPAAAPAPAVFYSHAPAEILTFKGQPVYGKIPGTGLTYATNTESDVFYHVPASQYYCLIAGRWFRAGSLQGPWSYATPDLPTDFAKIPPQSPAARVLASVPETPEAADAVLLAQVPNTAVVNTREAESKVKVSYYGDPEFKPVEGTSLSYAANTQEKIIKVGDLYYLCFQAVWFVSATPQGPWRTADSVPKEIYTIPPSSPVYNVTYVTQTTSSGGQVESSHTGGYLGMFVIGAAVGATIAYGSGYYYPPYVYYPRVAVPYPIYHPYSYTYGVGVAYNPYTHAYGTGAAAYGPYGGAGWGAAYNPSTGTYARGATAYGPYGSRTAAQAYNPWTGGYAATRQGSNPYAQWGGSVASRGDQWVATQHVSTASGTRASMQTSQGGAAVAQSGARGSAAAVQTAQGGQAVAGRGASGGSAYAGKSASGDVYAGKDGNVYKRSSSGGWQSYQNGGWNTVDTSAAKANAQQRAQSSERPASGSLQGSSQAQSLGQEFQNRQRGANQSERFQNVQRSGGGGLGGGGGRFSGGGRRR